MAAGMIGLSLGLSPLPFYTVGMMAPELAKSFGWTFTQLMTSVTVQSLVVVLSGPAAGFALDRYGARRVALVSMPLFGLAFMSLALANGSLMLFYAQWVVMSIVGAGTLTATWTRIINSWFSQQRGLALGVVSAGTGLTAFLVKPVMAWLILTHGWRVAVAVVGALPVLVATPLLFWLFREPALTGTPVIDGEPMAQENGLTLREALRQRQFWIMAAAFLLLAFALTATTPNMENILKSYHFTLPEIGAITSAFGLAVIAGRVGAVGCLTGCGRRAARLWCLPCPFWAMPCWRAAGLHAARPCSRSSAWGWAQGLNSTCWPILSRAISGGANMARFMVYSTSSSRSEAVLVQRSMAMSSM